MENRLSKREFGYKEVIGSTLELCKENYGNLF